jgi:hypothetical protein
MELCRLVAMQGGISTQINIFSIFLIQSCTASLAKMGAALSPGGHIDSESPGVSRGQRRHFKLVICRRVCQ